MISLRPTNAGSPFTNSQISSRLTATVSLILRRRKVAVRHRSLGPEQVTQASALYAEGLSLVRMAEELGVTRGAVNSALRAAGIQLRPRRGWRYD